MSTYNAANALKIGSAKGTLEKGQSADLLVLTANPLDDIRNTRKIEAVWKAGQEVSKGPIK